MSLPRLLVACLVFLFTPALAAGRERGKGATVPPAAWMPPAAPLLRAGDRLVLLGDSITVAHTWTRNVEAFLRLRHPDVPLTFVNAGIGGHTAQDGLNRLERDVLSQAPTVVVVNFGMNDAGYPPDVDGGAFERNMATLLSRLRERGVRLVAWAEPTPCDVEGLPRRHKTRQRDERLVSLSAHVLSRPQGESLRVVPWRTPVLEAMARWRSATGDSLVPDRIHPSAPAHGVMAAQVLKGLGYALATPEVNSRVEKGRLSTRAGGKQSSVPFDGTSAVTVDLAGAVPPVPFVATSGDAAKLGNADVAQLRALPWKVAGLPAGQRFSVTVGTEEVGTFSGEELAAGVDLMSAAVQAKPPALNPPLGSAEAAGGPDALMAACEEGPGNPFARDFDCVFRLLFQKDQLRVAMRAEKAYGLPAFVGTYREQFTELTRRWAEETDAAVAARAQALRERPHRVTLTPAQP
ncbi:MAG: SGNH/GDSL hydrolase family protein [Deltaproteobacteria bacterium]|nr:SGNH/GDSL hydrolase family protein [Deltaproteobacteria bacterium]